MTWIKGYPIGIGQMLAQVKAVPAPQLTEAVKREVTDDFVFSTDNWLRAREIIKQGGGVSVLNTLLADIASQPKMALTPGMLAFFQKHKNTPGLNPKPLEQLEKRGQVMKRLVNEVLRKKIEGADTVFTRKDWIAVKGEIEGNEKIGGLAALNYFLWVLSRSKGYYQIEKGLLDELRPYLEKEKINRLIVFAIKEAALVVETTKDYLAFARGKIHEAQKESEPRRRTAIYEELEAKLLELSLINQELVEIYDLLAEVQMALGKYDVLIDALDDFVQRHPEHLPGFLNLAKAYRQKGAIGGAKLVYEEAIQKHPNHYLFYYEYGLLLREVGEKQKAVPVLQKFLALGTRFGKEDPFFRTREPVARQLIEAMNREIAAKAKGK